MVSKRKDVVFLLEESMSHLNVLILHQMGDPQYHREAVRALEYMVPECRQDVNCVVHDANISFPEYLKGLDYQLIVLGPTFLCNRHNQGRLKKIYREYDFVRDSSACKVALPQDDYDSAEILDNWMVDWAIDRVYTVCPENWDSLYPKYSKVGQIALGYTGYVTDEWIRDWGEPKGHRHREIDVSYRTHAGAAHRCYLRNLKYSIADRFKRAVLDSQSDLVMDISSDIKDLIPGLRWHEFLENSRFCLATPSGSSLLDKRGDFRIRSQNYVSKHPGASFTEVEENCFAGLDRANIFTAISPRNIEAALAETVQIATAGSYSGLMKPMEHYIPLSEDCSNIADVLRMMADENLVAGIRQRCKEAVLSEARLRRVTIVDEIIGFAESVVARRHGMTFGCEKTRLAICRYKAEADRIAQGFWRRRRIEKNVRAIAKKFGADRIKRFVFSR